MEDDPKTYTITTTMAHLPSEPPNEAQRHIAKRKWSVLFHCYLPETLCLIPIAEPLNAMFTPLMRRVGGVDLMWPKPTCLECLEIHGRTIGQKAAAE